MLSVNPKCAYIVGLDIQYSKIVVALADLEGNQVGSWQADLSSLKTPQKIIEALVFGVHLLLKQNSIAKKKLYLLCAATPGVVDIKTGNVTSAPFLKGWENLPLRRLLETAFGIPSIVENEGNLSALGEWSFGVAKGEDNFVFLTLENGIGAGIFINGSLYRGGTGSAGEIGHMLIPGSPRGSLLRHLPGSLEKVVGAKAIEQRWREFSKDRSVRESRTAADILSVERSGDGSAAPVIEITARALSDAIVNITVLLDPGMIVLGGPLGVSQVLFDEILFQLRIQQYDLDRTKLCLSRLGDTAPLVGALKIALEAAETSLLSSI
jgi:glucokinase